MLYKDLKSFLPCWLLLSSFIVIYSLLSKEILTSLASLAPQATVLTFPYRTWTIVNQIFIFILEFLLELIDLSHILHISTTSSESLIHLHWVRVQREVSLVLVLVNGIELRGQITPDLPIICMQLRLLVLLLLDLVIGLSRLLLILLCQHMTLIITWSHKAQL